MPIEQQEFYGWGGVICSAVIKILIIAVHSAKYKFLTLKMRSLSAPNYTKVPRKPAMWVAGALKHITYIKSIVRETS